MSKNLVLVSLLTLLLATACYAFDGLKRLAPHGEPFPRPTAAPSPTLKLWLETAAADFTPAELEQTQAVLEKRLDEADIFAIMDIEDGKTIVISTTASSEEIVPLVTQVGLLELVDFSGLEGAIPFEGDCVITQTQIALYPDTELCAGARRRPDDTPFVTVITGADIETAAAVINPQQLDTWQVNFTLSESAFLEFALFTEVHIGEPLGIVLDGTVISTPIIQALIEGQGVIMGDFTAQEARRLATILRTGALPLPLQVVGIKALP